MSEENKFNKEAFALILEKAKGDRSINQYAIDTGVSGSHISRFLRLMIDTAPYPDTLSKLAIKTENGVTYRDLMVAAGHIVEEQESERMSFDQMRSLRDTFKKRIRLIILDELLNSSIEWKHVKPEERLSIVDLTLQLENSQYSKWDMCFKLTSISDLTRGVVSRSSFYMLYGQLATRNFSKEDKFSIVFNNKQDYEFILKRCPVSLNINLYAMLIDIENEKIIEETQISTYHE